MPTPSLQTPFHPTAATREGRRLYRKQVLPIGTVEHAMNGTTYDFTPGVISELVETFDGGAMTQVPFVLCDEKNLHNDDPERYRGEVKGLEARDDGLYALVEMTERGTALLEDNPTQPVSVRMVVPKAGKFAGRAVLGHVAATLDEVAKGMHPWERIEASSEAEVVDLSDGAFTFPSTEHGRSMPEAEAPTLTPEDQSWIEKLRDRFKSDPDKGGLPDPEQELTPEQEAEAQAALDAALAEPAPEGEPEGEAERTLEPAALSAENQEKIDLANSRAERAEKDAAEARAKAQAAEFAAERAELTRAGVPPADIELARPLLEHGDPDVIELSNGEKADAADIVRKLLASRKGTVDFSEIGSTDGEGTEAAEAKQLAKQMGEQYGGETPKRGDG